MPVLQQHLGSSILVAEAAAEAEAEAEAAAAAAAQTEAERVEARSGSDADAWGPIGQSGHRWQDRLINDSC